MMRITHTLLSSFDFAFRREDGYDDFLRTLRREKTPINPAMADGILFENLISEWNKGNQVDAGHEWYDGIRMAANILQGSAEQVYAERPITVDGTEYLLVGVADNIKAGIIYDTKFSKRYEYGKYVSSSQHPAYFHLFPEALCFKYLISAGNDLYMERYLPFDTPPIAQYVHEFGKFIANKPELTKIYNEMWRAE